MNKTSKIKFKCKECGHEGKVTEVIPKVKNESTYHIDGSEEWVNEYERKMSSFLKCPKCGWVSDEDYDFTDPDTEGKVYHYDMTISYEHDEKLGYVKERVRIVPKRFVTQKRGQEKK